MKKYSAVYEWAGGNWSVYSPDVDGCISVGDTLEEAEANFKEALEAHLAFSAERGYAVPEPTAHVGYVEVNVPAAVA